MPPVTASDSKTMPRKLNPDHIRRIIAQNELRGMEAVYLTGYLFNVAKRDERLPAKSKRIGTNKSGGILIMEMSDYHGWTKAGILYCRRCWAAFAGIPRDVIRRNWCETCNAELYPNDDIWLDMRGFELYRELATLYMGLAVRKYLQSIEGCECFLPNGRIREGFHKDHIYSVRDAFENDVSPFVVSAPSNLRMIDGKPNLSKGRKSDCTLEAMLAMYDAFLQAHPEWPEGAKNFYLRQETFACEP
jgi:hypothetical protein